MNKVICIVGFIAFFLMIGIVGAIDRGAPMSNILWAIPCLVVVAVCVRILEWRYYHDEK